MAKTRQALGSEIQATLFGVLDEQTWERLEEALIMADVGASTTASVVQTLEQEVSAGELEGGQALSERLIELLAATATVGEPRIDIRAAADGDHGGGRQRHGQDDDDRQARVAPAPASSGAACCSAGADTFRAAAGEQLAGLGASGRAARSSPAPPALTPARWPSTRSHRRAHAASTW